MKKLIVILTSALVLAQSAAFAAEPPTALPSLGEDFVKTQLVQQQCIQDVLAREADLTRWVWYLAASAKLSPVCGLLSDRAILCAVTLNQPCVETTLAAGFWSGCLMTGAAMTMPRELGAEYKECLDKAGVKLPGGSPQK